MWQIEVKERDSKNISRQFTILLDVKNSLARRAIVAFVMINNTMVMHKSHL